MGGGQSLMRAYTKMGQMFSLLEYSYFQDLTHVPMSMQCCQLVEHSTSIHRGHGFESH